MKTKYFLLLLILKIDFCEAQIDTFLKTYNITGAVSVDNTIDSGFIVTGGSSLFKTDQHGDTLWTRSYYSTYGYQFNSVAHTYDGGYIVAGQVNEPDPANQNLSSVYVFKTDSIGDTTWTYTWNPATGDRAYSVIQTRDSNYVIAGVLNNSYGFWPSPFLIKLNQNGDTIWSRTYDTSIAKSVIQTFDDGFLICGNNDYSLYLIKTDTLGDTLWTKEVRPNSQNFYLGEDGVQLSDSSYILTGYEVDHDDVTDNVFVAKVDQNSNLIWTKVYGGWHLDYGNAVEKTNDGGCMIAATTRTFSVGLWHNSDIWLLRLDPNGDTLLTKTYGNSDDNDAYDIKLCPDGNFILTGQFVASNLSFLLKVDSLGSAPSSLSTQKIKSDDDSGINIYPSPSTSILKVENPKHLPLKQIKIISILGEVQSVQSYSNIISTKELIPGNYIIIFEDKDGNEYSAMFIKQ